MPNSSLKVEVFMRITSEMFEDAHDYMKQHWTNDPDVWDDFTAIEVYGDTELLAHYLVQAGAINSKLCYEDAKPVEKIVEELARRFRKLSKKARDKRIDKAFENCFISSCNDCNAVQFLYDGNEQLYSEVKTECWECSSNNIETYYWKDKK